jgi:glycosyltransferase involved in cell wall biosynthesis
VTIALSVVVASSNAIVSIRDCLGCLVRQVDASIELIVVDNSSDGSTEIVRTDFPQVQLMTRPKSALINELWSAGIKESSGTIVAITTAHCIPSNDWIQQVLEGHLAEAAGVGGTIDGDPASGVIDWAVCFCRYNHFLPPLTASEVDDIAADNASYKRGPLFQHEAQWREGFWEPQLHRALAQQGQSLRIAPAMLVRHRHSYNFSGFMMQRFLHGQKYGTWRASTLGSTKRALMLAASPLIPFVLLQRTTRRVLQKGRNRSKFLAALPLIAAFYVAWACGEATGYAKGFAR